MTARPVSRKSEIGAKLAKAPLSSAAARRLCKAALKHYGSYRKAAAGLGLKNYGQFKRIQDGLINDPPEMKAALKRADRRAKRAWEMLKGEGIAPRVDVDALRGSIQSIEYHLRVMRETLKRAGVDDVATVAGVCADRIVVDNPPRPRDVQPEVTDKYVRSILAYAEAPGAFEYAQAQTAE